MQNQRYQVNISVGEALYRQLKAQAAREDRTIAAVARRLLGAHYGVEARPPDEIPLHPDASGNLPRESLVERYGEPMVDLGEPLGSYGPEGGADHGEMGGRVGERPLADPARLAQARAALARADRPEMNGSGGFGTKPGGRAITRAESRVEYDHEALRGSKRSGNDSGRGL